MGRRGGQAFLAASAFFAAAFLAAVFFARVFLAAAFFAAVFVASWRRLLGRRPSGGLLRRTTRPPVGQQLGRAVVGELLDLVVLAQPGVGLAVGDVRRRSGPP